ncbi:hypothetical protein UYO_2264 [Lachnospiraceae bacterium JC7]|nr:hypothetical protein UYO_2264 [Lachnospiraceae bacterium JC7]
MKKFIFTPILAVADIVLLIMIIVSVMSAGTDPENIPATAVETYTEKETETTMAVTSLSTETTDVYARTEHSESTQETKPDSGTIKEGSLPLESESTWLVSEADKWLHPGIDKKEESLRDISAYDTNELPNIKDFKWVTTEILTGNLPKEAESIGFEEALGGWKCYILDDAIAMERLANMEIEGTMDELELHIDWYYTRSGGKSGEASEDNTQDSVFHGFVNEAGDIEAEGTGRIQVTDIYTIGDRMYAHGKLYWPDGIVGYLFLVRP